jgi:hypothetical protein
MMPISRCLMGLAAAALLTTGVHAQEAEQNPAPFVSAMRLTVSPSQAQQIISERLLHDGVAAGFQTLRQALALTPAQEGRWRDFMMASNIGAQSLDPATLVDAQASPLRLAQMNLDLQRELLAREARRVRAMERLYKSLDESQKTAFDTGISMIGSLAIASASNG